MSTPPEYDVDQTDPDLPVITDDEPPAKQRRGAARWVLPVMTCGLIAAGLITVGAGMGGNYLGTNTADQQDPWAGVSIPSMPPEAGGLDPDRVDGEPEPAVSDLVDPEWVERVSEASHIASPVLAAYAGASLLANETFPECQLGWNTLAAIGDVETQHGSFGGSRLRDDGVVHPSIIGPQLDGSEGVAKIYDTDGGELDGDTLWDRAVGPMQFIPTTWQEFGQDGSGDGEADVNNIEDAALSAAVYLCSYGDMTVEENWIDAIDAYNPSVDYNQEIADRAAHYGNFN